MGFNMLIAGGSFAVYLPESIEDAGRLRNAYRLLKAEFKIGRFI